MGLLAVAQAACARQHFAQGTLYVVATPIGNLADITLRAVHVLNLVDAVACEDTRVGGQLLRHLGIHKPLVALHDHNEHEASNAILARLQAGQRVALISDAGTPAISDPGAWLVERLRQADVRCIPIPGASAVATAMSVAGCLGAQGTPGHVGHGFRFVGFLPAKATARQTAWRALAQDPDTLVLYESPHRIVALAQEAASFVPTRRVTVARELTKQFESLHTLPGAEWPAWLAADANRQRGEFVVVVHAPKPPAEAEGDEGDGGGKAPHAQDALLQALLAELPLKQAVAIAVAASGAPRNDLYQRALALKAQGPT